MSKQISTPETLEMSYGQSSAKIASKELEAAILSTVAKIHAIFNDELIAELPPKKDKGKQKKRQAKKAA